MVNIKVHLGKYTNSSRDEVLLGRAIWEALKKDRNVEIESVKEIRNGITYIDLYVVKNMEQLSAEEIVEHMLTDLSTYKESLVHLVGNGLSNKDIIYYTTWFNGGDVENII